MSKDSTMCPNPHREYSVWKCVQMFDYVCVEWGWGYYCIMAGLLSIEHQALLVTVATLEKNKIKNFIKRAKLSVWKH